jgi:hypothetical protein
MVRFWLQEDDLCQIVAIGQHYAFRQLRQGLRHLFALPEIWIQGTVENREHFLIIRRRRSHGGVIRTQDDAQVRDRVHEEDRRSQIFIKIEGNVVSFFGHEKVELSHGVFFKTVCISDGYLNSDVTL